MKDQTYRRATRLERSAAPGAPFGRRTFMKGIGAATLGTAAMPAFLAACSEADETPDVAATSATAGAISAMAVHDIGGFLNIYGAQQDQATQLAVDNINEAGGVLGRQIELRDYDAQSQDDLYVQFANTEIPEHEPAVFMGGITSSTREALRPVMERHDQLYIYNALYEGGVCDKNVFLTGSTPSQLILPLVEYAMENVGNSFYIWAPDYNFGTINALWFRRYVEERGGKIMGEDFLPLDATNFQTSLGRIQSANPGAVYALPVGDAQTGFYEQYAASGLKDRIPLISSNYGEGNQQLVVPSEASQGIITCNNYLEDVVDNEANEAFARQWHERYGDDPIISSGQDTWIGWHWWAQAVEAAGSIDQQAVIEAMEGDIEIDAPEGLLRSVGPTHHLTHYVYIAEANSQRGFDLIDVMPDQEPTYEMETCDLQDDPSTSQQFTPEEA